MQEGGAQVTPLGWIAYWQHTAWWLRWTCPLCLTEEIENQWDRWHE